MVIKQVKNVKLASAAKILENDGRSDDKLGNKKVSRFLNLRDYMDSKQRMMKSVLPNNALRRGLIEEQKQKQQQQTVQGKPGSE